ncbi:hypothetical protein Fmac_019664 [Flemingia macrophylla]|uniref:Uncharacterized protein n=1 Tax=Flemingia macrophylla TaxID=520843 RepID=A0ABD1M8G7_9FABA
MTVMEDGYQVSMGMWALQENFILIGYWSMGIPQRHSFHQPSILHDRHATPPTPVILVTLSSFILHLESSCWKVDILNVIISFMYRYFLALIRMNDKTKSFVANHLAEFIVVEEDNKSI